MPPLKTIQPRPEMTDKPKAPEVGLLFPKDPRKPDERGSTYGNKNAWAAATRAISEQDAEKLLKEKNWRGSYNKWGASKGIGTPETRMGR